MDVIVLGLGVNGLAVVRSLGEKGLTISGVYNDSFDELGVHSKYIKECRNVRKACTKDELLTACDNMLLSSSIKKPVLICTTDAFASVVAENQDVFSQRFLLTVPSKEIYWQFLAKQPTAAICTNNSLAIPKTVFVSKEESLLEACQDINYPVIVKPDLTFDDAFPGKNVIVNNRAELEQFLVSYPQLESRVVAQEIVPSGDGKIFVVTTFSDVNGKVRSAYSGKKIRQYLPDYGVTCFGVSIEIPELKQKVITFLEKIGYIGFATLEFAYNEETDEYLFIELNIRTFYHNQLFKDAGLDINYNAYLLASGQVTDDLLIKQKDDVHWIDFTRDLGSYRRKRVQNKIIFSDWIRDVLKARSFAYLNRKDMKPFIVSIARLFSIIRKQA